MMKALARTTFGVLGAAGLAQGGVAAAQSIYPSLYHPGLPMPPRDAVQPTYEIRDAVITAYTRPAAGSGILHVYVPFHVHAPGNFDYIVYWTYLGETQFLPPVGSVCRIQFHYEPAVFLDVGRTRYTDFSRPGLFADSISCNTGDAE